MASEFDLIARYFTRSAPAGLLGVGDDCALFPVPAGEQVATSTDLLLEGRHFFPDVDPKALGHKALAVNLSDLAAMGAQPIGCVLGLALPRLDEPWLAAFADGFHALAAVHGCPLIGGDTTRSAHDLAISVTVFGAVPAGAALRRDGARADDDIWVSGELGAADVAYRLLDGQYPVDAARLAATRGALEWPAPQVALGLALRGIAHAYGMFTDFGRGDVLTVATARRLRGIAALVTAFSLAVPVLKTVLVLALTLANGPGGRHMLIDIDVSDILLALLGGLLFSLAWAMEEAAQVAEENRGFI